MSGAIISNKSGNSLELIRRKLPKPRNASRHVVRSSRSSYFHAHYKFLFNRHCLHRIGLRWRRRRCRRFRLIKAEHVSGAWAERERSGKRSGAVGKWADRERSGERAKSAAQSPLSPTLRWYSDWRLTLTYPRSAFFSFSFCTYVIKGMHHLTRTFYVCVSLIPCTILRKMEQPDTNITRPSMTE